MSIENELCNLIDGIKINNQHYYFQLAKEDIYKLAYGYSIGLSYNQISLELYDEVSKKTDEHNLKIVIQYIKTYGLQLFEFHLNELKYRKKENEDYSYYMKEYIIRLNLIISFTV
jgi:hypothetical protein